MKVDRMY